MTISVFLACCQKQAKTSLFKYRRREMSKKLIVLCLALAVTAWSVPARADSAYSLAVQADQPLAFWEFENDDGIAGNSCIDTMGNQHPSIYDYKGGNTGVLLGGNWLGKAAYFTGTYSNKGDFIDVPDPGQRLESSYNVTLELWMNACPVSTDYGRLISHAHDGSTNYELGSTNSVSGGKDDQLSIVGCGTTNYTWPPNLWDNEWNYLVVTYSYDAANNQTAENWYVNTVLEQGPFVVAGHLSPPDSYSDLTIGCKGGSYWVYNGYVGWLDEVDIYDKVLNQGQMNAHYAAIPEPATITLLSLGGLVLLRKRT
jgi:hypothetical protein